MVVVEATGPQASMRLLWVTEPSRSTCLATVTAVDGVWFQVDRALFAPKSRACRHPQMADKGTVWIQGEKRRLDAVRDVGPGQQQDVWYRLRGTVPPVGAKLQCELDAAHRRAMSHAHTAMHLFAFHADAALVCDPEVRGGGHARLTFDRFIAPPDLAAWLARANQDVAADIPVEASYMSREEARHVATPQHFTPPDPLPGPDVLPMVRIGQSCVPCDGTHVDRTGRIGRIRIAHAAMGRDGFVVVLRA